MKSIAFGPYLGDFKYEVFYFLPYIRWVKEVLNPDSISVCSHFNREFLYENLIDNFFPINPMLTIDEFSQKSHFNKNVYKNKYNSLEREFKNSFENLDEIDFYNFEYNRFKSPCSCHQLKFERLKFDVKYRLEDKFIFIPDRIERSSYLQEIYNHLKDVLGDKLIVIGDFKTHLKENNILLKSCNYHNIVYKEMIDYISSCKGVITPTSVWTGIANLQDKPVLSWGHFVSEYKEGRHYFGNRKAKIYPRLEVKSLKNCIDKFLEVNFD